MLHIFKLKISLKLSDFLAILLIDFLSGCIYLAELLWFHRNIKSTILMLLLKSNIIVAQNHTTWIKCKKTQMESYGIIKVVKVHVSLHFNSIIHAYRCFCFSNASNSLMTLNDLIMDTSIISTESRWVAGRQLAQNQKLLCHFLMNILLKWRWVRR